MRNVILVCKEELQRVMTGGQDHLSLCLSASEMEVVRIVGNGPVEGRQIRVESEDGGVPSWA